MNFLILGVAPISSSWKGDGLNGCMGLGLQGAVLSSRALPAGKPKSSTIGEGQMDIYLEYAVVMDSTMGEVQMDLTWNILWP